MSFPCYPAYKDSGIEWLGEMPEHWGLLRIKRLAAIRYGIGEPPAYVESGVPLIRATNVSAGRIVEAGMVYVDPDDIPANRVVWLESGDILVVRSGAYTGDSALVPDGYGPAIAGFDMVLRCLAIEPSFLQCVLLSRYMKDHQIELKRMRAAQPHLNAEELGECMVLAPPKEEQSAIATFLDRETAKIDALVADYRTLIELLQEKRQAVISHAVTKGLDPTVPMKDSGVEWLGEVPEHWNVAPLKYLVSMQSGGTPSKDNLDFWNGDIPWASAKDMKAEVLWDTTDHVTQNAIEAGAAPLVPAGSILVVVRGMILARTFPVAAIAVPMAINQDLKALQTTDRVDASYLVCCLKASEQESRRRIDEAGHGTKALRMDAWTSMELPVPPVMEQTTIAALLARETAAIDSLITDAEEAMALLQERRTALISAAVTGKIDVRGLVAIPETDLARSCG